MKIHKFISKAFVGWSLDGYVPAPDGGHTESGVTVAGGFDIGQRSVDQIDDAFDTELADKLAPYADALLLADWERATKLPFSSLIDEQRMVMTSLAYQYGDLPSQCPMAWKQATTGDWEALLRNLWNFGDAFKSRRRQEYAILLWGMCK